MCNVLTQIIMPSFLGHFPMFYAFFLSFFLSFFIIFFYHFPMFYLFFFARFTRVLKWPTRAKKGPIYTRTS
jgi:hypothetical protein